VLVQSRCRQTNYSSYCSLGDEIVQDTTGCRVLSKYYCSKEGEPTYEKVVFSRNVFGIPSNYTDFNTKKTSSNDIILYRSRRGSSDDKVVYIDKSQVTKNSDLISRIKVLVSKASPGGDEYPHAIFSTPFVSSVGSVCTETYLVVDLLDSEEAANNLVNYMKTRLFRFLVSLIKNTQNISKGCFAFVPVQDFTQSWTDEKLYAKYNLTQEEIAFIESMIRPMELGGGNDD
jgi:site-specific DNA-methyltransferase (adenine-specific)